MSHVTLAVHVTYVIFISFLFSLFSPRTFCPSSAHLCLFWLALDLFLAFLLFPFILPLLLCPFLPLFATKSARTRRDRGRKTM